MRKILVLVIGLSFLVAFSGCTVGQETKQGILTTEKTTTSVGIGGVQKETKTCPFWDRDC